MQNLFPIFLTLSENAVPDVKKKLELISTMMTLSHITQVKPGNVPVRQFAPAQADVAAGSSLSTENVADTTKAFTCVAGYPRGLKRP